MRVPNLGPSGTPAWPRGCRLRLIPRGPSRPHLRLRQDRRRRARSGPARRRSGSKSMDHRVPEQVRRPRQSTAPPTLRRSRCSHLVRSVLGSPRPDHLLRVPRPKPLRTPRGTLPEGSTRPALPGPSASEHAPRDRPVKSCLPVQAPFPAMRGLRRYDRRPARWETATTPVAVHSLCRPLPGSSRMPLAGCRYRRRSVGGALGSPGARDS